MKEKKKEKRKGRKVKRRRKEKKKRGKRKEEIKRNKKVSLRSYLSSLLILQVYFRTMTKEHIQKN